MAYVISLHEYKSIGTQWLALCVNGDNVTSFDSLEVQYTRKWKKLLVAKISRKIIAE